MNKTGIIILAAGNSSRMGEPKQLMRYQNKTLLQHIVDEALDATLAPVICITGYKSTQIAETISGSAVNIVYNENWIKGMGTGISLGIKQVLHSDVDSVIIAVSDQPFVSSDLFRQLHNRQKTSGSGIVASSYAGTLGTPVLFTKKYFDQLMKLQGNQGAKSIVQSYNPDVSSVVFEKGNIDIDTKQDYENLISEKIITE